MLYAEQALFLRANTKLTHKPTSISTLSVSIDVLVYFSLSHEFFFHKRPSLSMHIRFELVKAWRSKPSTGLQKLIRLLDFFSSLQVELTLLLLWVELSIFTACQSRDVMLIVRNKNDNLEYPHAFYICRACSYLRVLGPILHSYLYAWNELQQNDEKDT